MQMFSSSLFVVLVATSRGQRMHSEGKVQSFFARPPPQWELPLAPIGSGFSYQQLPLAERGERWPGRFSSSFWHVAVPVGRRQTACGEVPRGRARVQVSRCATDGDSFGGGSIGWRWVRPCRCAKTVTWEELGGWGRGERFSDDLVVGWRFWRKVWSAFGLGKTDFWSVRSVKFGTKSWKSVFVFLSRKVEMILS